MPEPADLIAGLVALLAADSGIDAAVADRVFGGELPESEAASMPRRAIVVRHSGGVSLTGGSYVEHDTRRIDVFTYGATPAQASGLMALVELVLRRVRRQVSAGALIHWCKPAGGYSPGREPGTEWPRVFQSFQVLHALESVS